MSTKRKGNNSLYNKGAFLNSVKHRGQPEREGKAVGKHTSRQTHRHYLEAPGSAGNADNFGFFFGGPLAARHLSLRFNVTPSTSLGFNLCNRTTQSLGTAGARGESDAPATAIAPASRLLHEHPAPSSFRAGSSTRVFLRFGVGDALQSATALLFRRNRCDVAIVSTAAGLNSPLLPLVPRILWSGASEWQAAASIRRAPDATTARSSSQCRTWALVFGRELSLFTRPVSSCWLRSGLITSLLFDCGDEMTRELSAAA